MRIVPACTWGEIFLLLLTGLVAPMGCVERELYIKSEPPGASIFLDGRDRGVTPVTVPFEFYGPRLVELRLKKYGVVQTIVPVERPWYQYVPLDFIFEFLWPGTLKDVKTFHFDLETVSYEDLEQDPEIMERAEKLRNTPMVEN